MPRSRRRFRQPQAFVEEEDDNDEAGDDRHDIGPSNAIDGGDGEGLLLSSSLDSLHIATSPKSRLFVCPFYQNNPDRVGLPRVCHGPGWLTIHRLKYENKDREYLSFTDM